MKRWRLAIEAKDQTTGEHLQRVRVYAMELAKELGLSEDETEALRAASVLHDIGKLAVPEHIISKPGKLTPEEFEKMKIHPIGGAEILEQVDFPYPVVPIVRAHHEKWDGSGYPNGLAGEAIPIGARILAAVDCLDALASDRQYRKALPLDEAMAKVVADAGKSFDPQVVAILHRRYIELEKMANEQPLQAPPKLSTDIKVERGLGAGGGVRRSAGPDADGPGAGGDSTALVSAGAPARSGNHRTQSQSWLFVKRRRHSFSARGASEKSGTTRLHGRLLPQERRADGGVCQWGQFPVVLFLADSAGRGPLGMGRAKP